MESSQEIIRKKLRNRINLSINLRKRNIYSLSNNCFITTDIKDAKKKNKHYLPTANSLIWSFVSIRNPSVKLNKRFNSNLSVCKTYKQRIQ